MNMKGGATGLWSIRKPAKSKQEHTQPDGLVSLVVFCWQWLARSLAIYNQKIAGAAVAGAGAAASSTDGANER